MTYCMCALTPPCPLTPRALELHDMSEKRPKKGAKKLQNLCGLATDSTKPRMGNILGYMAQNAIPRARIPTAAPHFLWFPALQIAQTDA